MATKGRRRTRRLQASRTGRYVNAFGIILTAEERYRSSDL